MEEKTERKGEKVVREEGRWRGISVGGGERGGVQRGGREEREEVKRKAC